jgi:hypothetical protein
MAFFLIDDQNQITRINRLVISAEGIATPRGSKNPLFLEGIYEAEAPKTLSASQREAALVEITLVQIEYLAQRFLKERKLSKEQLGAITIYGSSSLTLTILPNRISHDVDVAVSEDFREFINAVCSNERPALGQLEINTANPIVLRFCGNYHQRSRTLTGSKQSDLVPIEVLHPLDTLSQKLLRIPLDVFQQKDIPDIDKILRKLKPKRETLVRLLRESFERYTTAAPDEMRKAAGRNTRWLFKTYFTPIDIRGEVVKPAVAVFTTELKRTDLLPPPTRRLKPRQIGTPDLF